MRLTLSTGTNEQQIDLKKEELTIQVGCTTLMLTSKYIHLSTEDKRIVYKNRKQDGEVLVITKDNDCLRNSVVRVADS